MTRKITLLSLVATLVAGMMLFSCTKEDEKTNDNGNSQENPDDNPSNDTIVSYMKGVFSVSDTSQVYFSPGNLQWSASGTHAVAEGGTAAGTWRLAPPQYDTIGCTNTQISSAYTGWIDLFGWGTSGYNNKYPYMVSETGSDYGDGTSDISGTNYDWGVYNAIQNPKKNTTDAPGTWRTLTNKEWIYVLNTRTTASGMRYAKAIVDGVRGLILIPDNWNTSTYTLNSTNAIAAFYSSNNISSSDWTTLENAGCAFLPACGERLGVIPNYTGNKGDYWSSTSGFDHTLAYNMNFEDGNITTDHAYRRQYGYSVRLVMDKK